MGGGDDGCSGNGASWWSDRSRTSSPTGGLRRVFVRGHANVFSRLLIHVSGFNLGLLMRHLTGGGTLGSLQGRVLAHHFAPFGAKKGRLIGWNRLWKRFWASIRLDLRFWASRTHQ